MASSAQATGEKDPLPDVRPPIPVDRIKLDFYEAKPRAERKLLSAEERLARPFDEVDLGISQEQALEEVTRCFSCGKCFACENCWMYCHSYCFAKYPDLALGHYYKIKLETCDGCKKCAEECPCGFIDLN